MAATISVRVYTGTNAATESSAQTGISFLSIDSSATDSTTRQNNPVVAGTNSYEKHLRWRVDAQPSVSVGNYKVWCATSAQANVGLRIKGSVGTGGASPGTGDSTPTATAMTGDASIYSYTSSGTALVVDSATYTGPPATGTVSKATLLQLQPTASATPGAWTQHTISYSYDEI